VCVLVEAQSHRQSHTTQVRITTIIQVAINGILSLQKNCQVFLKIQIPSIIRNR
jgi:hypothetical protein